ncbi:MAG: nucleotidyltransferase substrate binding protein [Methanobrevibacter sp.]|jgi:hypothetical protein|nr:nucleotidyltransferase substrate binding protein [Methanobrevibacter sp.]
MEEKLDISSLLIIANSYCHGLEIIKQKERDNYDDIFYEKELHRAGLIHYFQYSYDLSLKIMERYLLMDIGDEAKVLSRNGVFKMMCEKELMTDFHQ